MAKRTKAYGVNLTPLAEKDLEDIWAFTAQQWSVKQANHYVGGLTSKFDMLASNPFLSRERTEFTPPVRINRHQSHVIIYRLSGGNLEVLRIAHMRQNWAVLLDA